MEFYEESSCRYDVSFEEAVRIALSHVDTPATRAAVSSADVLKFMAVQLQEILALAKGGLPTGQQLAFSLSNKALAMSGLVSKDIGSASLKVGNFFVGEMLQTLQLMKVWALTPTTAIATITANWY
ncbi:hypothetical protein LPW11_00635 [Geomonas sp. RF6]|uniref:hypothetical protein n=1 Tax=Geomonas sp. RF6 TaxID=2897342 RepID=UPI001E44D6C8|nr:hypothetical protein [Geomonas sp. RF6]UFS70711.1 hypothetical protein LPW11_00635 [Geomonas sp. RF6]